MNILKTIAGSVSAALVMLVAAGCCKNNADEPVNENRKVLLFYECAFNDIGSYIRSNMEDQDTGLPAGYIPSESGDALLVYSRISNKYNDYTPVNSYLRRIYKSSKGEIISDTLKTFQTSAIAASPSTMMEVLNFVKEEFPAKSYGMVFSSHGSGWLPAGYYYSPSQFEADSRNKISSAVRTIVLSAEESPRLPVPEGNLDDTDPYWGKTRSIGQDFIKGSYYGHEMSISEFVDGIPYHLDYILFDMCFSGGVEIAYGLKDKADYLGMSPAEVLGEGMYDYTKITSFLLNSKKPDLEGLFKDAFEMYNNKEEGTYRSATVNLIRTDGLDNLASVCSKLVNEYSDAIADAPTNDIQGYFRSGQHYFYDLADIFAKCGASETELKELNEAIDRCVIYQNATPRVLDTFDIETYSGFSMYLPCAGTPLLDSYYRKEAWNEAVGLVK